MPRRFVQRSRSLVSGRKANASTREPGRSVPIQPILMQILVLVFLVALIGHVECFHLAGYKVLRGYQGSNFQTCARRSVSFCQKLKSQAAALNVNLAIDKQHESKPFRCITCSYIFCIFLPICVSLWKTHKLV